MARHRVVLVREWDAQMSSSGCCGRLGGVCDELGEPGTYAHVRADMEAMGAVYRTLRAAYGRDDVELAVVDPRNMIWLIPAIVRDGRRRDFSAGEIWSNVRRGVSRGSVIADGRTLFSCEIPQPQLALAAVRDEIGAPAGGASVR